MNDVIKSWTRIENWLSSHAPLVLRELQGPATKEMIDRVVEAVGDLPDDYRALMQTHDGVVDSSDGIGVLEGFVLCSLRDALSTHNILCEVQAGLALYEQPIKVDAGVRAAWWHDGWLPIAVAEGDAQILVCLDLDPAPGGVRGQVIRYVGDMAVRRIVARSVSEWVDRAASAMEAGQVSVTHDQESLRLNWPSYSRR